MAITSALRLRLGLRDGAGSAAGSDTPVEGFRRHRSAALGREHVSGRSQACTRQS